MIWLLLEESQGHQDSNQSVEAGFITIKTIRVRAGKLAIKELQIGTVFRHRTEGVEQLIGQYQKQVDISAQTTTIWRSRAIGLTKMNYIPESAWPSVFRD